MEDIANLIEYKGYTVLIRRLGDKFQIGFCGENGLEFWFDNGVYDTLEVARTSGKEYARIIIDKLVVGKKKNKHNVINF